NLQPPARSNRRSEQRRESLQSRDVRLVSELLRMDELDLVEQQLMWLILDAETRERSAGRRTFHLVSLGNLVNVAVRPGVAEVGLEIGRASWVSHSRFLRF